MRDHRAQLLRKLGAAIKEERMRQGISQEQLALRADLERAYMGTVERGEKNISVVSLARIAGVLNVSMGKLISDAGL